MKHSYRPKAMPLKLNRQTVLTCFFIIWAITLTSIPDSLTLLSDYFSFLFLGVLGAIFANSTGAGGGVVFIPMFNQLGFSDIQAVATSFAIQCFGMTAGAISWYLFYKRERQNEDGWQSFYSIIKVSTPVSLLGLWTAYGLDIQAPAELHEIFSLFSIVLGLIILFSVYWIKHPPEPRFLNKTDVIALLVIGYFGGIVTAFLSVGVGELIAVYLILRRYDVTLSVATAVVISALSVWSVAPQHALIEPNIYWQVVLFAGPGAVVGGLIARPLVNMLSARRLKVFFACWILIVGIVTSPIPSLIG